MRLRKLIPRAVRHHLWRMRQRVVVSWQRPWRPEWLPFFCALQVESAAHPHVPAERSGEFLAATTGGTEIEVLNWLNATVCLLKPGAVLETGTFDGLGTIALAAGCRANGRGHVQSLEIEPENCAAARERLARHGLAAWATVHCMDSREFLKTTSLRFDLAFFDSLCELRADEYEICLRRGLLGGTAVFHDTSPRRCESYPDDPPPVTHTAYRRRLLELAKASDTTGWFESTLSRGLFMIFRG
jgi:predicted O-methyltransferase YrrM